MANRRQDYIRRYKRQGKPRLLTHGAPVPPTTDRVHLLHLSAPPLVRKKVPGKAYMLYRGGWNTGAVPELPHIIQLRLWVAPIVRRKRLAIVPRFINPGGWHTGLTGDDDVNLYFLLQRRRRRN